jgi:hypothetical protein
MIVDALPPQRTHAGGVAEQGGPEMASRGYDRDGSQHDAVVSNLMDLQARLRGDPASLVLPRDGRRDDAATTVRDGDLSVTIGNGSRRGAPGRRALKRRLEYLELEIDAYEHVAAEASRSPARADQDRRRRAPAGRRGAAHHTG